MDFVTQLNAFEDELILKFRSHVCDVLADISDASLMELLLQKRFLALQFTPVYDEAISFFHSDHAVSVARYLRDEEYPVGKPSHREDLIYDLGLLGIDRTQIGSVSESPTTIELINALYALVRPQAGDSPSMYDLRASVALRFAEEILVAEEHRMLVPLLERRFGFSPPDSRFYIPHLEHDQKTVPLGELGDSHSDGLGSVISELITDVSSFEYAKKCYMAAYGVRENLYFL